MKSEYNHAYTKKYFLTLGQADVKTTVGRYCVCQNWRMYTGMKGLLPLGVKRIKLTSAGHHCRKPTGTAPFTESSQSEALSLGISGFIMLCINKTATYSIVYSIRQKRQAGLKRITPSHPDLLSQSSPACSFCSSLAL